MNPNNHATEIVNRRKGVVSFNDTIRQIQEYVDLPLATIKQVLRGIRAVIYKNVINGYSVRLMPGMTFQARHTHAHTKRLPNNEEIFVPEHYTIKCDITETFNRQILHALAKKTEEGESEENLDFDWEEFPE